MVDYQYRPQLVEARFLTRVNRFVAAVSMEGADHHAHLPTSGRLRELLVDGAEIWLRPTPGSERRTQYCVELVRSVEGELVSINSQLPNRLMERWLSQERLGTFCGYGEIQREPRLGEGRSDLRLIGKDSECLIEIKSVTLVVDGQARFPDAPTTRGARHLHELAVARSMGKRTAVCFVIQRSDARSFAPNHATDPEFAQALRAASERGVEIIALSCKVAKEGISLSEQVPIVLV